MPGLPSIIVAQHEALDCMTCGARFKHVVWLIDHTVVRIRGGSKAPTGCTHGSVETDGARRGGHANDQASKVCTWPLRILEGVNGGKVKRAWGGTHVLTNFRFDLATRRAGV